MLFKNNKEQKLILRRAAYKLNLEINWSLAPAVALIKTSILWIFYISLLITIVHILISNCQVMKNN